MYCFSLRSLGKLFDILLLLLFLQVHILPHEMLGRSTFGLSMSLLRWLPLRLVDQILLILSRFILGDTARLGLSRPKLGPLQLKNLSGKTPVLDVGTFAKIKTGKIKVCIGLVCSLILNDFF